MVYGEPKEGIVKKISGKKHIAGVYEVRGEQIKVWCDLEHSWSPFSADYNGKHYGAKDIDALLDELKRATKRKKVTVSVPFTDSHLLRDGIATGKHEGNGNLLVTWDDGSSEQITRSYHSKYVRLTTEQKQELKRLQKIYDEAQRQLNNFREDLYIDLEKEVADAVGEVVELAIAEEETPDEEKENNVDSHDTVERNS